jgi:type II secretory pathway component GspD/PulD (secretin)
MSRSLPVVAGLLLGLALPAPAQVPARAAPKPQADSADKERATNTDAQAGPRAAPKPRADVKVERLVYAVRGASAKELANALSFSFKDEAAFQVFPDAGSNSLLLSGPEPVLDDAMKVLREIDRPARTVHVEVFLVEPAATGEVGGEKGLEAAELSGPAGDVLTKLRDLQRRGLLAGVKRVQFNAVERQDAQVKVSENRPHVTAVYAGARGGFGGTTQSITYQEVGTLVSVKPEVGGDGVAALDLRIEDSRVQTPASNPTVGPDEKGEPVKAANFVTASFEGRVRVPLGQAVLAEGMRSSSKSGEGQLLILVAATEESATRDRK